MWIKLRQPRERCFVFSVTINANVCELGYSSPNRFRVIIA